MAQAKADFLLGVRKIGQSMRKTRDIPDLSDFPLVDIAPTLPAKVTPDPAQPPTVRMAAPVVRDRKVAAGEIRNAKHAANWLQVLERHALPALGHKALGDVTQRRYRRAGTYLEHSSRDGQEG